MGGDLLPPGDACAWKTGIDVGAPLAERDTRAANSHARTDARLADVQVNARKDVNASSKS